MLLPTQASANILMSKIFTNNGRGLGLGVKELHLGAGGVKEMFYWEGDSFGRSWAGTVEVLYL